MNRNYHNGISEKAVVSVYRLEDARVFLNAG